MLSPSSTDTLPPISGPRLSLLPLPSPLSLRISRLTLRRDPKREEMEEEVTAEAVAEVAVEAVGGAFPTGTVVAADEAGEEVEEEATAGVGAEGASRTCPPNPR